jgi:antitoxin (DNA-binding transcriptional repressor) of toxin-antitoxin stability system
MLLSPLKCANDRISIAEWIAFRRGAAKTNTLFSRPEIWHVEDMTTITLEKAQQELPTLIERVLAGEDIVIGTQRAAVRLTPVTGAPFEPEAATPRGSYRGRGALKGELTLGPEFFEPLTDDECGVGRNPEAR